MAMRGGRRSSAPGTVWNDVPAKALRRGGWAAALLLFAGFIGAQEQRRGRAGQDGSGPETPEPRGPLTFPAAGALRVQALGEAEVKLEAGDHLRPSGGTEAAVLVDGQSDFVLDLRGVRIRGAAGGTPHVELEGIGIHLRNCRNVRILGGRVEGYRLGVLLESCRGVRVEGLVCEDLRRPELRSTEAAENLSDELDLLSHGELPWGWELGAGVALLTCEECQVRGVRVRRAQGAVLLDACRNCAVVDCDVSYPSAVGVALRDGDRCQVLRNRVDGAARGYHKNRDSSGMGAAGIALLGHCVEVTIADNVARSCSNGVLLDGGHGAEVGVERCLVLRNDLSGAVAAGLRAEWCRDLVAVENNLAQSGGQGIVAEYVRGARFEGNDVSGSASVGVRFEQGSGLALVENLISDCQIGVDLSFDLDGDLDAELRSRLPSVSRDFWVVENAFSLNDSDLILRQIEGTRFSANVFEAEGRELFTKELVAEGFDAEEALRRERIEKDGIPLPIFDDLGENERNQLVQERVDREARGRIAGMGGWIPSGTLERVGVAIFDREEARFLADWLPFEDPTPSGEGPGSAVTSPWVRDASASAWDPEGIQPLRRSMLLMGPEGPWDPESGEAPPSMRTSGGLFSGARWATVWFHWTEATDPRGSEEALERWRALSRQPALRGTVGPWLGPFGRHNELVNKIGSESIGLRATTEVALQGGRYRVSVLSDDGVRLSLGETVLLENWSWHPVTRDVVEFDAEPGVHAFELEYFQIDGAARLAVDLERLGDSRGP